MLLGPSDTRITPAWAGKSSNQRPRTWHRWDHPRMGGEKLPLFSVHTLIRGSPPHGRGKGPPKSWPSMSHRITPAWAGKSPIHQPTGRVPGDHPRMGGEKFGLFIFCQPLIGSPPHGRGKDVKGNSLDKLPGITPAWAGKRHKAVLSSGRNGDHPRMGGEKQPDTGSNPFPVGSPPHGRGKGKYHILTSYQDRITPAWAGKRKR